MSKLLGKLPLPIWLSLSMYKVYNKYRLVAKKSQMDKEIRKCISVFAAVSVTGVGDCIDDKLIKDIKSCYVRHLAKPQEYLLLGFQHQSSEKRNEWITDFVKDTYLKKYAKIECAKELQDKFFIYNQLKPYFKRDACTIARAEDKFSFLEFSQKHQRFIAKPNTGSFGADTKIWDMEGLNADNVFDDFLAESTWILEELIEQVPEMGQFNISSVNSVRIPTFKTKDGYQIFGTFMRMGRKGAVVDNAGAGGVFVRVDEQSGQIVSDGYSEIGERFPKHPDSGITFRGFQIPYWNELRELAIECHKKMPKHKYIGWDFALTRQGWVLLEGNWGQFLCQQVSGGKPLKNEFVKLIKG